MPYIGRGSDFGVRSRFIYTATANQTTFSGNDDAGITLAYTDTLYMDVYQNGVLLVPATDYAASTGTSVVLVQGASVDDTVEILVHDIFSVADSVSAKDGGSFAGNVGMGGTLSVTGTSTLTGVVTANGGAVFNEGGADVDFRVESNGNANMFVIDANADSGAGQVNIGTTTNAPAGVNAPLYVGGLANTRIAIDGSDSAGLYMTDSGAEGITIRNALGNLEFYGVAAHEFLFNKANLDVDFRVASDTITHALFVQGSDGNVGVGAGASLDNKLEVIGSMRLRGTTTPSVKFNNNDLETVAIKLNSGSTGTLGLRDNKVLIGSLGHIYATSSDTSLASLTLKKGASGADSIDYIQARNNSNDAKFIVAGDGDVTNTNNSYGAVSDQKLKENIVDATNKLEDLKQVQVRNYNLIGSDKKHIGVVAQELETIFPALISESIDRNEDGEDLGTTTKSVKYSVFVPMLIKAMQEQQATIEALEARITALEAK